MQTSITTWLKKPATVKQPPKDTSSPTEPPSSQLPQLQLPRQAHDTAAVVANNNALPPPTPPPSQPDATPPIFKFKTSPLPVNIRLQPCTTSQQLSSFQRLNTILLPIPYPQKFYQEILSDKTTNSITILALWFDDPSSSSSTEKGRVVGGIRCRLLPDASTPPAAAAAASQDPDNAPEKPLLYISTLGVLAPYRSLGVATHLLQEILVRAIQEFGIGAVGAHVWEISSEARAWYKKRGFKEVNKEEGYYRRLQPQGAFVLRRDIGPRDLLSV